MLNSTESRVVKSINTILEGMVDGEKAFFGCATQRDQECVVLCDEVLRELIPARHGRGAHACSMMASS